jgi:hypothetical protein
MASMMRSPKMTANFYHCHGRHLLLQNRDDMFFTKPAALHIRPPLRVGSYYQLVIFQGGHVTCNLFVIAHEQTNACSN